MKMQCFKTDEAGTVPGTYQAMSKHLSNFKIIIIKQWKQRQKVDWCMPGAEGGKNRNLLFNGGRVSVCKMNSRDGCIVM